MRRRLPFALAILAVAALGVGLAACGGGGGGSEESPQAVIENATLEGIESANLDLSLKLKSTGKEGSNLDVNVSGPFESQEGSNLPQLGIEATAKGNYKGEDVNFDGGLVLLPNSAFVKYEGVQYEVDPTTFGFVESILDRSQKGSGGESKGITGCREAVGGLDFTKLGEHLKNEGTVSVGGTDTTKLSGDLDPTGASDLLAELSEDPACRTLLGAAGKIPSVGNLKKSGDELRESVKTRPRRVLRRRRRPHRPPRRRGSARRTEGLRKGKQRSRSRRDPRRCQRRTGNRRAERGEAAQRPLPQARHQPAGTRRLSAEGRRGPVAAETARQEGRRRPAEPLRRQQRRWRRRRRGEGGRHGVRRRRTGAVLFRMR